MQNFSILLAIHVASLCSCTDWFEFNVVCNPEDRFSI